MMQQGAGQGLCRPGAERARELFFSLCRRAAEGAYDDAYLAECVELGKLRPAFEYLDVFYAKYALAYRSYEVALEHALRAQEKRPVNYEVWLLLLACYTGLGRHVEAALYQGWTNKFYQRPVELKGTVGERGEVLKRLTFAEGAGNYAPVLQSKVEARDGCVTGSAGLLGRDFLPLPWLEGGYGLWVGVEIDLHDLAARGKLLDLLCKAEPGEITGVEDITFDMRLSREAREVSIETDVPCLLALAGTEEQQRVSFATGSWQEEAALGQYAFQYFRAEENVQLRSERSFIIARPVRLVHSPARKRLVLNILLDALPWRKVRDRAKDYMPQVFEFFSQGQIFEEHFAASEYTYPALANIETGLYSHNSQIFNEKASCPLSPRHRTMAECFREAGYHCVGVQCDGSDIYNGVRRGYDRLVVDEYSLPAHAGVDRVIRQLEACGEADQFLELHIMDTHPWLAEKCAVPEEVQAGLPLRERMKAGWSRDDRTASVYLPNTELYHRWIYAGMQRADRSLGLLFAYLQEHYAEDEYVVCLYSDHGAPVFDEELRLLGDGQVGAMLMVRGGQGRPRRVHELTSSVDIFPIAMHMAGLPVPRGIDGNLPAVYGGREREYVLSESIFPGQATKIALRTREHECQIEAVQPTEVDGTADFSRFSMHIYERRAQPHRERADRGIEQYFLEVLARETQGFDREGRHFPSMRNARPEWFKGGC